MTFFHESQPIARCFYLQFGCSFLIFSHKTLLKNRNQPNSPTLKRHTVYKQDQSAETAQYIVSILCSCSHYITKHFAMHRLWQHREKEQDK